MTNPFILSTPEQVSEMLRITGAASIDELFTDQIPKQHLLDKAPIAPGLTEPEIARELGDLAASNTAPGTRVVSFMGGGVYDHFIPAAVGALANRSEFVTAYTPYQFEASQGTLQAFFEFQSLVARLFAMDVSNASLYDGASALGEALYLALGAKPDRTNIVLPQALHPDYRAIADTYLRYFDVELRTASMNDGVTDVQKLSELIDDKTAAVVLQHPNYLGCLEDTEAIANAARDKGALLVAVCDPVSLGLLEPPGTYGADIAVGEGQGLGLRPFLGGESVGFFTCKKDFIRKVPGRLVGMAQDREKRRGYVLTLQTREQHIRRAKATSNICTNHAHNALRTAIYMCLMGPQGMHRVARACARNLQRFRTKISAKNAAAVAYSAPTFKEVTIRCKQPARVVADALLKKGFFAGVPLHHLGKEFENLLLVCTTEKRTDAEIDAFAEALGEFV